jgi:hypothetical protein
VKNIANSPIQKIIDECKLPHDMNFYVAEIETPEIKHQRFLSFAQDLRDNLGPEFLNELQRIELFNFSQKNVQSHTEILLAYKRLAELLINIQNKKQAN